MESLDYLAPEEALIQLLKSSIPALADVHAEGSLTTMKETALESPSALVVYAGDRLDESDESQASLVHQAWLVVLAVKAPGDRTGADARNMAGPLITQILETVRGFEPGDRFTAFRRINGPRPELLPGGTLFIPLAFETSLVA